MIDERFAASVAAWLLRTDRPSRHAHDDVANAMAQIHQLNTRRRRRWPWSLPASKPTAGALDEHDLSRPPAQVTLSSIGGTTTMFSPIKLVSAAAVASLMGMLFLVGPFSSTSAPVTDPGQATSAQAPSMADWSAVFGTRTCTAVDTGEQQDLAGGDSRSRGEVWDCTSETNDARVNGAFTLTANSDCFSHLVKQGAVDDICLHWGTAVMEDESGWECSFTGTNDPYAPFNALVLGTCDGTGGNAGWTYVYEETLGDYSEFRDGNTIQGMIYEGGLPPFDE